MKLQAFQQQLASALLTGESQYSTEAELQSYARDELEARLAVYRNNIFYSLNESLKDTFSSIHSIVGDEFFQGMTQAYLQQSPPTQAELTALGDSFPDFIQTFAPCRQLPYLSDCARMDWARHCAYYAADAAPLSARQFTQLSSTILADCTFTLHPSLQIVCSRYAVFDIWELTDNGDSNKVINYQQPQAVLIVRPSAEVCAYLITSDMAVFFAMLLQQKTLSQAIENTQNNPSHAGFNPTDAVAFLISSGATIELHPPHQATPL